MSEAPAPSDSAGLAPPDQSESPVSPDSTCLGLPDSLESPTPSDSVEKSVIDILPDAPFRVGERLVFSVEYGFVTAGEATMSVVRVDMINGYPAYLLQSLAQTNEIFSAFYKVDDRVESHLDVNGFFSRHFMKRLREGSYKKDLEVFFDQEGEYASYAEGDSLSILPGSQDVLSAFFFLRTQDLNVGKTMSFPCHDNKKNYPLEVKVLRKEKIMIPLLAAGLTDRSLDKKKSRD